MALLVCSWCGTLVFGSHIHIFIIQLMATLTIVMDGIGVVFDLLILGHSPRFFTSHRGRFLMAFDTVLYFITFLLEKYRVIYTVDCIIDRIMVYP